MKISNGVVCGSCYNNTANEYHYYTFTSKARFMQCHWRCEDCVTSEIIYEDSMITDDMPTYVLREGPEVEEHYNGPWKFGLVFPWAYEKKEAA